MPCFSLCKGDQIFISYKREQWRGVDLCVQEWRQRGYNLWVDEERIKIGDVWNKELEQAIDDSKAFIAFLDYEYFYVSEVCKQELTRAQAKGLPIFPILVQTSAASEDDVTLREIAERHEREFQKALVASGISGINYASLLQREQVTPICDAIDNELQKLRVRRSFCSRIRPYLLLIAACLFVIIGFILWLFLRPPSPPAWFSQPSMSPSAQGGLRVYKILPLEDFVYFAATDSAGALGLYSKDMTSGDPSQGNVTLVASIPGISASDETVTALEADCDGRLWIGLRRFGVFITGLNELFTLSDLIATEDASAVVGYTAPFSFAKDCEQEYREFYVGYGAGLLRLRDETNTSLRPVLEEEDTFTRITCRNEVIGLALANNLLWALQRTGNESINSTCNGALAAVSRFSLSNGISGDALQQSGERGSVRDLQLDAGGNLLLLKQDAVLFLNAQTQAVMQHIPLPLADYQQVLPIDEWIVLGTSCLETEASDLASSLCVPLSLMHPRWSEPLLLSQSSFANTTIFDLTLSAQQRVIWFGTRYGLGYFRLDS